MNLLPRSERQSARGTQSVRRMGRRKHYLIDDVPGERGPLEDGPSTGKDSSGQAGGPWRWAPFLTDSEHPLFTGTQTAQNIDTGLEETSFPIDLGNSVSEAVMRAEALSGLGLGDLASWALVIHYEPSTHNGTCEGDPKLTQGLEPNHAGPQP